MKIYTLETKTILNNPIDDIFPFFANAENLDRVTPPWLKFEILTPLPIEMKIGTIVDYRLQLHGIPIRWRSKITEWNPPLKFTDVQIKGPYRFWKHEHLFIAEGNQTRMTDRVQYAIPGWIFAPLIHLLLVQPDLEKIFRYRERKFLEIFKGDGPVRSGGMNMIVPHSA
ncbi:MAG: SRPBCC family protein [candidate division KSB1 bacterium]|nr:SRPBCC family protein [candidate division KSB1 bacterium]MDZ7335832.1 SRPBCC family protein [candidate division KSB1 bacterium]MDZ7356173.1 SRPBCC family protein [candidate division KSB1 bacterium]MDZ7400316.1 SRPBCC family protein [candidate division KSB1 bacterium]